MEEEKFELNIDDIIDGFWSEIQTSEEGSEIVTEIVTKSDVQTMVTTERINQVDAQKAISILMDKDNPNSPFNSPDIELLLLSDDEGTALKAFHMLSGRINTDDIFIRACPEHARHGVIESIRVDKSTFLEEWKRLSNKMKEDDPNGCLLLQPFINATSSMVLAPNQYAVVGEGHDGVTASHGMQLYYWLKDREIESYLGKYYESLAHTDSKGRVRKVEKDNYELEFVFDRGDEKWLTQNVPQSSLLFTQLRGAAEHFPIDPPFTYFTSGTYFTSVDGEGVPINAESDAIEVLKELLVTPDSEGVMVGIVEDAIAQGKTHLQVKVSKNLGAIQTGKVTVVDTWVASGLEEVAWLEENITKETMPEGFVIAHPDGSLLSHICAHARTHDIPYIVGNPKKGETWVEGSKGNVAKEEGLEINPQPYDPFHSDYQQAFTGGLLLAQSRYQRQHGWFSHFFHQWVGLNPNGLRSAVLAGAYAHWLCRSALSICLGELRHTLNSSLKGTYIELPAAMHLLCEEQFEGFKLRNRQHYFASMENISLTLEDMQSILKWCAKFFDTKTVQWSRSFGGLAYQQCALQASELAGVMANYLKNQDKDTLQDVIQKLNAAENWRHNTGSLFNKFLHATAFDYGTHKFSHKESSLIQMSRSWELADKFFKRSNEDLIERDVNWVNIFDYLLNKTPAYWRENIISISDNVPVELREAVENMEAKYRHIDGPYSDPKSSGFIPCGVEGCEICPDNALHSLMRGKPVSHVLKLNNEYSVSFPIAPDNCSEITYAVCGAIQSKDYDSVESEHWLEAWKGLSEGDAMFDIMKEMLVKMFKIKMIEDKEWIMNVKERMDEEDVKMLGGDE